MIRVRTGSRLHFGLIRLPPTHWPDDGLSYFGGVGLMIDEPAVEVEIADSAAWSFTGPHDGRVARYVAGLLAAEPGLVQSPKRIRVVRAPAEHVGLGLGTQLGLAVARGLMKSEVQALARWTGRGRRSAIGVHGFIHGGLIHDGGKSQPDELGTLANRIDFPAEWRVILATPKADAAWCGQHESVAFGRNRASVAADKMSRLADEILAAATRVDLAAFGAAVHEFNRLAGEPFREAQGGVYSSPAVDAAVEALTRAGALGVGQSSWGPTVFGFLHADDVPRMKMASLSVATTVACNSGVEVQQTNEPAG